MNQEQLFPGLVMKDAELEEVRRERDELKQLLLKVCTTFPSNRDLEVYGGQELVEWYKQNKPQ